MSEREYIRSAAIDIMTNQVQDHLDENTMNMYQKMLDQGMSEERAIELLAQWSQLSKLALFYFFGNKRVSFLLVVKYNYLFIILFPLLLLYNVVKKEGASMFVRVIKNNKGKKNTCFCALVESYRDSSGVPKHRVLINFGQVDEESVPFLKAAFAKKKPRLVYDDE